MSVAALVTLAIYGIAVVFLCPAYLSQAVPLALALYAATDVPLMTLLRDCGLLLAAELAAAALLVFRWRSMPHRSLMLVLVCFAVCSTLVCLADGKDWFYHRLPAIVSTALALLLWFVVDVRCFSGRLKPAGAIAFLALALLCGASIQHLQRQLQDVMAPKESAVGRLQDIIIKEQARTYIAFSEWIALGFPVVNNTGVTWASRFDSMWALKGEIWRANFDGSVGRTWPIARWVTHDFIAGCPDIAVVDTRETTNYIKILSSADPAFARAWTRYKPIAAFDGLIVFKRSKSGCIDVWVAAGEATSGLSR